MASKSHRRCEICQIKEGKSAQSLFFTRFPLDEDRCKQWLRAVGNEELVHLPIEKLHETRHICGAHFEKKCFNRKGNRLKRNSIPKLSLLATPLTDEQLKEFPQHTWKSNAASVSDVVPMPSTSQQDASTSSLRDLHCNIPMPSTSQQDASLSTLSCSQVSEPRPSTSQQNVSSTSLRDTQNSPGATRAVIKKMASLRPDHMSDKRKIYENADVTPRKRKLLLQLQKTRCTLSSLKKSAKLVENIESPILKEFVNNAVKNQFKKPQGKRWSTLNKISALAIFKRSPKAYRYLQYLMPLPSTKTLQNLLKKIPMEPGINKYVLSHLSNVSKERSRQNKICSLAFDEMALKPSLNYNVATEKIEGFQEDPERSSDLADHALVFLLQGIHSKFKQPLAFYFVKGTISSQKLAVLIKEIIRKVTETGFEIVTTVCDQGPTNTGALKILKSLNQNRNYFEVDGKKILIIFDVPHLFKSVRNNFLNCGEIKFGDRVAKWAHLIMVEEKNQSLLYLSKITRNHVHPKYRAKMRVKYAAQILSNTVAAVLKLMSQSEAYKNIANELMDSALVIQELDKLFDATNGPSGKHDIKKNIRENVSLKTNHVQIWADYRKILSTVNFIKSDGTYAKNVKCINGYITSLSSLQDLWQFVSDIGFKYLNLRQVNQDALENLFGLIRQHSPTDKHPTCAGFVGALKTAIISGMTAPHSRSSNCEEDEKKLLTNFHNVIFNEEQQNEPETSTSFTSSLNITQCSDISTEDVSDVPILSIPEEFDLNEIENDLAQIDQQALVYVSGYISSLILKSTTCTLCKDNLIEKNPDDKIHAYIKLREWWNDRLCLTYPSINLCKMIESAISVFENEIISRLHFNNICKLTVTLFYTSCNISWFTCTQHSNEILNMIFVRLGRLLIRRQCTRINQTLSLKEENLADLNKRSQQVV